LIVIEPYHPEWPEQFASLGRALREVLGDLALRVDHIGDIVMDGAEAWAATAGWVPGPSDR